MNPGKNPHLESAKNLSTRSIWKPRFIREWAEILRSEGLKGFIKKKGITLLFAFIAFYAIRDTLLYIVIPLLLFKGIITCK